MKDLSRGLEAALSLFTGVLGAPIAAGLYWLMFRDPTCTAGLGRSVDCVVAASGEHWSWLSLATSTDAVIFGFILAGLAFIALEMVNERSDRPT